MVRTYLVATMTRTYPLQSSITHVPRGPTKGAMAILKSTLRYVSGLREHGLGSNPDSTEGLEINTDANWAGFHSISGCVYSRTGVFSTYKEMPVSWTSAKQHAIAPSSANSELYAMSTGVQTGLHITYIGEELNMQIQRPMTVLVDASPSQGRFNHIFHQNG